MTIERDAPDGSGRPRWRLALLGVAACSDDNGGTAPTTLEPPTGLTAVAASRSTAPRLLDRRERRDRVPGRSGPDRRIPATFAAGRRRRGDRHQPRRHRSPTGVAYSYQVASVSATDTSAFSATVNFTTGPQARRRIPSPATSRPDRTLFADTLYILSGYVKVHERRDPHDPGRHQDRRRHHAAVGSSLWILRGAKIDANGTADAPIVFTSHAAAGQPEARRLGRHHHHRQRHHQPHRRDHPDRGRRGRRVGELRRRHRQQRQQRHPALRPHRVRRATTSRTAPARSSTRSRATPWAAAPPTSTSQTMAGLDDSFEFWGGAVDGRYLVSYESGDDHFDWTEGYRGRNQFLIAFQNTAAHPGVRRRRRSPPTRAASRATAAIPAVAGCTSSRPMTRPRARRTPCRCGPTSR